MVKQIVVVVRNGQIIGRATDALPALQAHAAKAHLDKVFPLDGHMVVPATKVVRCSA